MMPRNNPDAMIEDVTNSMEVIQIPDSNPLVTPNPNEYRPLDSIEAAGPPAPPIEFDPPNFERGRRDDVLVYIEQSQSHQQAKNVLFRDFSRDTGDMDGGLNRVRQAYWPLPNKQRINTIMGHVEICIVLKRCTKDVFSDESSSDSESSMEDGEEDIVFQVTNQYVAVKVNYSSRMDQLRNRHAENPLQEIAAMQLIGNSHPNVMGTIEVLFDGENLNVVMPYCGSGDLFELLQESQRKNEGFPESVARYWFRQIMEGVKYLHAKGVCHRDLSPENVMIDKDDCLIIDMGMAMRIPYTDPEDPSRVTDATRGTLRRLVLPQGACGKLPYMSPEIYRSRQPFDGGAVDIWTAGTILFCMVTGNRSYQRPHETDPQFYWMTHGLERLLLDWGVQLSVECIHLMKHMLQIDPRLRLTLEEVLSHPWIQYPNATPPSAAAQIAASI